MRVLTLLEILQAREAVSGAELAARLEVDLRTVQRYIARLRDLKIPVEASRGVGGAYRLRGRVPAAAAAADQRGGVRAIDWRGPQRGYAARPAYEPPRCKSAWAAARPA